MTDREINEAVARKLGWTITKTIDLSPWYWRPNCPPEGNGVRELPAYSTSIEAAWEIVEKISNDGLAFRLERDFEMDFYRVEMCHVAGHAVKCGWTDADIAPLAICLAFLKLKDEL